MRLDIYLVEKNLADSRARAQALIKAGKVLVNGVVTSKASKPVTLEDEIGIDGVVHNYVSRGGLKLAKAIGTFDVKPEGKICLDLGASTGGFSDVLLRAGAAKIYAVDVGHSQLHTDLAKDPRIINLEKTHSKDLSPQLIPDPIEILVCDVSFISLKKAMPQAMALCVKGARLLALIKPQFEVGRAKIGKGGMVKDSYKNSYAVAQDITAWFRANGWTVSGYTESPITGGDGNREFFIGATNQK